MKSFISGFFRIGVSGTFLAQKQQKERSVTPKVQRKRGAAAVLFGLLCAVALGGCAVAAEADVSGGSAPEAEAPGTQTKGQDSGMETDVAKGAVSGSSIPGTGGGTFGESGTGVGTDVSDGSHEADLGQDAMALLRRVLLGEEVFYYADDDGGLVSGKLEELREVIGCGGSYCPIEQFAVVDLDGDGGAEAVLQMGDMEFHIDGFVVLHCMDGAVYAFGESERAFDALKADGTYATSNVRMTETGICRMRFAGYDCAADWVMRAVSDAEQADFEYFAEGESVTEEEYQTAMERQNGKEDAVWHQWGLGTVDAWFVPADGISAESGEAGTGSGLQGDSSEPERIADDCSLLVGDIVLSLNERQQDIFAKLTEAGIDYSEAELFEPEKAAYDTYYNADCLQIYFLDGICVRLRVTGKSEKGVDVRTGRGLEARSTYSRMAAVYGNAYETHAYDYKGLYTIYRYAADACICEFGIAGENEGRVSIYNIDIYLPSQFPIYDYGGKVY